MTAFLCCKEGLFLITKMPHSLFKYIINLKKLSLNRGRFFSFHGHIYQQIETLLLNDSLYDREWSLLLSLFERSSFLFTYD